MFFLAFKIFWALAQPSNLLLSLLAAGTLALLLGRRRLTSWLPYPATLGFLLIRLFPGRRMADPALGEPLPAARRAAR
jgi:hypothetical protein